MTDTSKPDFDNMSLEELNRLDAWMDKVAPASLRDADDLSVFDRSVQVGLKRNGSGNRVRTLEEDRKQRSRRSKLQHASIDVQGHPIDVYRYDPIEGVIYSQVIERVWSEANRCWENNYSHGYRNPDVYPNDPLPGYIRLAPINWRADRAKRALCITYEGERYYAHRLAWELYHGTEPGNLKFVDGNPSNLKLENLVPVASAVPKPYQARVSIKGKVRCLGSFETKEARDEAVNAFKALHSMGIV